MPNGNEPSKVTTRHPLVDFTRANATPPSVLYLDLDSRLYVRAKSDLTGSEIVVRGQMLQPDGLVRPFDFRFVPTADRNAQLAVFNLSEGFLLGLSVATSAGNVQEGVLFAEVGILRGRDDAGEIMRPLISDYLLSDYAVGWPPGRVRKPREGGGSISVAQTGNPAAGAEHNFSAGSNRIARLYAVRLPLTTSAVAANRQVQLALHDNAGFEMWRSPQFDAQTASLTRTYLWARDAPFTAAPENAVYTGPLPDIPFFESFSIRTLTENIDAGDDWNTGRIMREEWFVA